MDNIKWCQAPMRALFALVAVLALVVAAACRDGGAPTLAPAPTSAQAVRPAQSPLDVLRSALDALSRGDADAVYAALSQDVRSNIDLDDLRGVIGNVQTNTAGLSVTVGRVDEETVAEDMAEISLTLHVRLAETVVPLDEVASFVLEEGQWRIADHLLETVLTALGLEFSSAEGPYNLDVYRRISDEVVSAFA